MFVSLRGYLVTCFFMLALALGFNACTTRAHGETKSTGTMYLTPMPEPLPKYSAAAKRKMEEAARHQVYENDKQDVRRATLCI